MKTKLVLITVKPDHRFIQENVNGIIPPYDPNYQYKRRKRIMSR